MCIIFIAHQMHPRYPLIIATNRDEFLDRPTEPMKLRRFDSAGEETLEENGIKYPCANTCNNEATRVYLPRSMKGIKHEPDLSMNRRRYSLAGKDLVGGGTWLGLDLIAKSEKNNVGTKPSLRWIALTNYRGKSHKEEHGKTSRGELLLDFLGMKNSNSRVDRINKALPSAESFISDLQQTRSNEYNGFNLLAGDAEGIHYYGNQVDNHRRTYGGDSKFATQNIPRNPLVPGIYGLSNALLDTPWPKVERGKKWLRDICEQATNNPGIVENDKSLENVESESVEAFHERLMQILQNQERPPDEELPNTGIGLESERYLSSIYVPTGKLLGDEYGTRSSTTIVLDVGGKASVLERTWPTGTDQWFHFEC